MRIDLNCDLGESFGIYSIGNDAEIMKYVTSVNIACGFHAGDPEIMDKTVKMALENGVAIGAHPGFDDLAGFGRREMKISSQALHALIIYQVGALKAFVESQGGKLQHVKPHGALYNMASRDDQMAMTIAKAVYSVDPKLILMGLAGSSLTRAGRTMGLKVAEEFFADRRYDEQMKLVSRQVPNAVIKDIPDSLDQCLDMIKNNQVVTINGNRKSVSGDTICIHGDNAHGIELAKKLRYMLQENGINIQSLE